MAGYGDCIDTWDSSAAVWYGLNGIKFDNSPTGSYNGKFEKEVDFSFNFEDNIEKGDWENVTGAVDSNLMRIDNMCGTTRGVIEDSEEFI
jgi:hypothetical protein